MFIGELNWSGDTVLNTSAPTLQANYCHIQGQIYCSASGNMNVIYAAEVATAASGILVLPGACGIVWAMV